ncbi:MAG: spore coat protein [Planctomycetes bacterium DG_23]|nr:MAG: spore coat protein [Planctomycetes bacterium DG_23]
MRKILVTGGCGFMGSDFIRYMVETSQVMIVNLDKLTYAGNPENLKSVEQNPNYHFIRGDIADQTAVNETLASLAGQAGIEAVVNFAAESHVDRSIMGAEAFVHTNVLGTQVLLEAARKLGVSRFIQISTDEVYGTLGPEGKISEESPLRPNSPYAATKAAADLICRSYFKTYGFPVIITRSTNNFGPYQFPEKLIPLFVTNALEGKTLPLYGDGLNMREWLFVRDHSRAIERVLEKGTSGEIYNIATGTELTNLEITKAILRVLERDESLIEFVKDRPGHDRRYALDWAKLRRLGWGPQAKFEETLRQTVAWYKESETWWRRVKSGEYLKYYQAQYGKRGFNP